MNPTYCKVFEAVGDYSAIARVCELDCRILLEANWDVTVVAKFLSEDLRPHVQWRPLHVPERAFAWKWATARRFLLQARGADHFDCVHGDQPQIADKCDLFRLHFLTRAAANRGILAPWRGKRALTRAQEEIVLRLEDGFMKRLAHLPKENAPHVMFISELMREEFTRLYGAPARSSVEVNSAPPIALPSESERQSARSQWASEAGNRMVVGFLGGTHERKGFRHVLRALEASNELFLLFGGPASEGFNIPDSLKSKMKVVGFVDDVNDFFAACDAFVVAAQFEPLGMVALEASSRGVPVIAGEGVGALPTLLQYGCGSTWPLEAALEPLVKNAVHERASMNEGATRMCAELGAKQYAQRLLALCDEARQRNVGRSRA
ncbi:glycosyltransferase [bacterium]|nr:MAG: glycosyltransferase [bacterium]